MTERLKALPVKTYLIIFLALPHILSLTLSASSVETGFKVNSFILNDFMQTALPANAKWSFSAVDIEKHKKLFNEGNAKDDSLTPGSIVKLFVTAAILDFNEKEKFPSTRRSPITAIFMIKNL